MLVAWSCIHVTRFTEVATSEFLVCRGKFLYPDSLLLLKNLKVLVLLLQGPLILFLVFQLLLELQEISILSLRLLLLSVIQVPKYTVEPLNLLIFLQHGLNQLYVVLSNLPKQHFLLLDPLLEHPCLTRLIILLFLILKQLIHLLSESLAFIHVSLDLDFHLLQPCSFDISLQLIILLALLRNLCLQLFDQLLQALHHVGLILSASLYALDGFKSSELLILASWVA